MKNTFYLYELNKWSNLGALGGDKHMEAEQYIKMHILRLQYLLEGESHIASDKYALDHDTCPIGAYNKIIKDRNDAIEFWNAKLEEL